MRQGGHRIFLCEMIISQPRVISAQIIKTKKNQDTFDSATAPTRYFHLPIIKPSGGS
jgi:hypothetical protein